VSESKEMPEESPRDQLAARTLRRMLDGRARTLLDSASREVKSSDAPAIFSALITADESIIHQPAGAAQEALGLVRDPNSSTDQVVKLFERDPALTQSLLHQANSIFYRRDGEPCASIRQAVLRIGARGVESVVTTSMVEAMLCKPGSAYAGLLTETWGHMTRTGPFARDLALVFMVEPEVAFTLGLLHDLGKLVILDHLSRLRAQLRREVRVPPATLHGMIDRLHEPLGGIAMLRWGLGEEAAHAVANHQRTPPPPEPDYLGELLYVANMVEHVTRRHGQVDFRQVLKDGELTVDPASLHDQLTRAMGIPVSDFSHARDGEDKSAA
jgi:HD-like signal output (HDOD) protein